MNEYIKNLISSYSAEGYKYYILHKNDIESNYDYSLVVSKNKIIAFDYGYFNVDNAIFIDLDSNNIEIPNIYKSDFKGIYEVINKNVIYSNSEIDYNITTSVVAPNLFLQEQYQEQLKDTSIVLLVMLVIFFLYFFMLNIFRG